MMCSNPLAYEPRITKKRNDVESYPIKICKKGRLGNVSNIVKSKIRAKTVVEKLSEKGYARVQRVFNHLDGKVSKSNIEKLEYKVDMLRRKELANKKRCQSD